MSMKLRWSTLFLLLILVISVKASAQFNIYPKGNLFIIGGGERSPELINEMVKTAQLRAKDNIVVLPMAASEPDSAFRYIASQLARVCGNPIVNLNFDEASVNNPSWLDTLGTAKLIYIPGGDQNRFMKIVLNTPVYDAIHRAYHNGSTIAGTSAGAAVMSEYMITGKELLGDTTYYSTFQKLWNDDIAFEQGLGLLDSVIIDQHFIKRSRYNRLITALNAHPNYDCIGIDEGTALVVHQHTARIVGESQVIKLSEPKNLNVTSNGLIKFQDVKFSIFTDGDSFFIK